MIMKQNLLGIDIGGTKCAVIYGVDTDGKLEIADKVRFETTNVDETVARILSEVKAMAARHGLDGTNTKAVGISCGGPLDSRTGVVQSPPNLPGWDNIPIVKLVEEATGIRAALQNDANACALAEWKYGAGRGSRNMVFLTFGTGMGAGLVLDGKLYAGTNDNAGEIGHIRLAPSGPVGYNKEGSAEGFCSGAGMARLAKIRKGLDITTKELFARVRAGDPDCTEVFRESAEKLATILAYTIDILNPEVIALGGVFMRNADLFMPIVDPILDREALSLARKVCRIVPAELGENIGDYAALAVAGGLA